MLMNVSLPPELENKVRQRVESGRYDSVSAVIRDALNLFESYDQTKIDKLNRLREDIAQGMSDVQNGRVKEIDFDHLKQQGLAILQARKVS